MIDFDEDKIRKALNLKKKEAPDLNELMKIVSGLFGKSAPQIVFNIDKLTIKEIKITKGS